MIHKCGVLTSVMHLCVITWNSIACSCPELLFGARCLFIVWSVQNCTPGQHYLHPATHADKKTLSAIILLSRPTVFIRRVLFGISFRAGKQAFYLVHPGIKFLKVTSYSIMAMLFWQSSCTFFSRTIKDKSLKFLHNFLS